MNDQTTPYILFADDDPDTLEMLVVGARLRGWRSETATRVTEIITRVNERCNPDHQNEGSNRCYDAIITDINFQNRSFDPKDPRLSGISAVKAIRKLYPDLPVVFYTGFDTHIIKEQANIAGGLVSDFVVKSKPEVNETHKGEVDRLLDRVEKLIVWVRERIPYHGPERRLNEPSAADIGIRRRKGESPSGELVRLSPTLQRILDQSRGDSILLGRAEK